jgi:hypothetical protein
MDHDATPPIDAPTAEPSPEPPVDRPGAPVSPVLPPPPKPAPGLASLPGWYAVPQVGLRYWNGATWTDARMPAESGGPQATYGEKYKRRYPLVLAGLAVVSGLGALAVVASGHLLSPGWTQAGAIIAGIGLTLSLFASAAFWTLIAAAFRGERRDSASLPRRGLLRRPWTWALVALVVALPVRILEFQTVADVGHITVRGPAEGCRGYLDLTLQGAREHTKISAMSRYYRPLHDAAEISDPALAQDLGNFLNAPSQATFEQAETSILTRCRTNGQITDAQLTDWVAQLKKSS